MDLPEVVSVREWREARLDLLADEKALTRDRDRLSAKRRRLPMVEVEKPYEFSGPDGPESLLDLFKGRRQLIVVHFMFDPQWETGCASCSASADEVSDGLIAHLHARDTTLAHVSRAPLAKLESYRALKGWTFRWYSSFGTAFNYDFHVTLDESSEYNYRTLDDHKRAGTAYYFDGESPVEAPGVSCFLRQGARVFHTYSTFARGMEATGGANYWLDLTPLGRGEEWEDRNGRTVGDRPFKPDFAA
jgi:predicted dithiol-disulfide oxidoreductase (DUF899 family)